MPATPLVGDAPVVEAAADLLETVAPQRALEYLLHNRGGAGVHLQGGTLFHAIVDLDAGVAEGGLGAEEEPA